MNVTQFDLATYNEAIRYYDNSYKLQNELFKSAGNFKHHLTKHNAMRKLINFTTYSIESITTSLKYLHTVLDVFPFDVNDEILKDICNKEERSVVLNLIEPSNAIDKKFYALTLFKYLNDNPLTFDSFIMEAASLLNLYEYKEEIDPLETIEMFRTYMKNRSILTNGGTFEINSNDIEFMFDRFEKIKDKLDARLASDGFIVNDKTFKDAEYYRVLSNVLYYIQYALNEISVLISECIM